MQTVAELTSLDPICVAGDTPVVECARLMAAHDVRHLPVVRGGRLVGVVTDWSVFQRGAMGETAWAPFDPADEGLQASAIARPAEVVTHPSEPIEPVLRALLHSFQDLALVTDSDGRPVGILTEHDALRCAIERLDDDLWSTDFPARSAPLVSRDAPARRCLAILVRQPARHLLFTDEQALVGVLTFGDLTRDAGAATRRAGELLRRAPPDYAVGAVPVRYAAQVMLTQAVGCLPIVDRELRPLRVLTRLDVIRALLDTLEREEGERRQQQQRVFATT